MYRYFFKPLMDFLIGLIASIVLLPLLIIIGIIIFIDDPGPIFFRQKRIGKNKKLFTIWKLRTMKRNTPDVPTHLLENPKQYITRTGKLWRKLSIDELPNVFSLLTLKMSLIGPRPALWNQDDLIAERDKYGANNVRPGITGWAQINGRDELEIAEKAQLDGEYVSRMSFLFDCRCFFGTIKAVFNHEGVVEGGTGQINIKKEKHADIATEEVNVDGSIAEIKETNITAYATDYFDRGENANSEFANYTNEPIDNTK